ncbi:MAG: hypothetical protein ACP5Q4_01625 [Candidatus Caldatribacteriaceae bacterium]
MSIKEKIQKFAQELSGVLKERKGLYELVIPIAERKAFLSRQKLEYIARFQVNEAEKKIVFTEILKESGAGLSGSDAETSPGLSFKKETYNTLSGARGGNIEEQSRLLGKKYDYRFDFQKIRQAIEKIAGENGYGFEYKVTALDP